MYDTRSQKHSLKILNWHWKRSRASKISAQSVYIRLILLFFNFLLFIVRLLLFTFWFRPYLFIASFVCWNSLRIDGIQFYFRIWRTAKTDFEFNSSHFMEIAFCRGLDVAAVFYAPISSDFGQISLTSSTVHCALSRSSIFVRLLNVKENRVCTRDAQ